MAAILDWLAGRSNATTHNSAAAAAPTPQVEGAEPAASVEGSAQGQVVVVVRASAAPAKPPAPPTHKTKADAGAASGSTTNNGSPFVNVSAPIESAPPSPYILPSASERRRGSLPPSVPGGPATSVQTPDAQSAAAAVASPITPGVDNTTESAEGSWVDTQTGKSVTAQLTQAQVNGLRVPAQARRRSDGSIIGQHNDAASTIGSPVLVGQDGSVVPPGLLAADASSFSGTLNRKPPLPSLRRVAMEQNAQRSGSSTPASEPGAQSFSPTERSIFSGFTTTTDTRSANPRESRLQAVQNCIKNLVAERNTLQSDLAHVTREVEHYKLQLSGLDASKFKSEQERKAQGEKISKAITEGNQDIAWITQRIMNCTEIIAIHSKSQSLVSPALPQIDAKIAADSIANAGVSAAAAAGAGAGAASPSVDPSVRTGFNPSQKGTSGSALSTGYQGEVSKEPLEKLKVAGDHVADAASALSTPGSAGDAKSLADRFASLQTQLNSGIASSELQTLCTELFNRVQRQEKELNATQQRAQIAEANAAAAETRAAAAQARAVTAESSAAANEKAARAHAYTQSIQRIIT